MLVKLLRCLKLMHTQAFIRHIQNTCQEKGVIFHLHQCFFQKYGQKGVGGGGGGWGADAQIKYLPHLH